MTPSNPTNSQPLIYRIADSLGVFHLVAPVNHTHAQSEVEGLTDALDAKANAVPAGSPTGGIVVANTSGELSRSNKTVTDLVNGIAGKSDANHTHSAITNRGYSAVMDEDGEMNIGCSSIVISMDDVQGDIEVLPENANNLKRALQTPDSTPTANSTKLVTSGGVAAALAEKAPIGDSQVQVLAIEIDGTLTSIDVDYLFRNGNTQVTLLVDNLTGEDVAIADAFSTDTQDDLSVMDDKTVIISDSIVACRILKRSRPNQYIRSHYFLIIDGEIKY